MYLPEATAYANNGAIQLAPAFDWTYGVNGFSDEEMLTTMQVIKSPTWWSNMMMPGYAIRSFLIMLISPLTVIPLFFVIYRFSWPEGSPSPPANNMASPTPLYPQNVPGMNFGLYHTTSVI